jgi:small-conductance mechanosensitive channel
MIQWLSENWLEVVIPVVAFLATYVVGLWLRRVIAGAFDRWPGKTKWGGSRYAIVALRRNFLFWFLLLGAAIGIEVSILPAEVKSIAARTAGSLFILSLGWMLIVLSERLLKTYLPRLRATRPTISLSINIVRIMFIVVGTLIILEIWSVPTTPLLLLIAVLVLGAALVFRNAAPDLFGGFQLNTKQEIKVGDYIRLETGEEGYVTELSWNHTHIKALDDSIVVVPNNRLIQHTIINYGHPLKKAKEPFRFSDRTHLTELTGLKAGNLRELVDTMKRVPDSVTYYHTHHFLEEHHYLTSEPSNDFAVWVSDALGDEVLGERLASVDTFEFPSLATLKERLAGIIEEYLSTGPLTREAMRGREFYFMKSVAAIIPTTYIAHDLREFVEALRKISLGSIYFHVLESSLRLGRGRNDFTIWMKDSLGEDELGDEIARIDPYTYTLEGLRSLLILLTEKRIK